MPRKAAPTYNPQVFKPEVTPKEIQTATATPIATSSAQIVTQEKYDSFLVPKDLQ